LSTFSPTNSVYVTLDIFQKQVSPEIIACIAGHGRWVMKVGVGLPAISGISGQLVLDWARKVDAGPFSSLGSIDRIAYGNYESLIMLAAAAGVTQRVRLMTSILLAPVRNSGVLAKQLATLDAISGGRLTAGLAVGGREDDYRAAPASFRDRGQRFEEQLALMKRIWSGEPVGDGVGLVGPRPHQSGGPEVLIGAASPAAVRRVGRWADGFISVPLPPEQVRQLYSVAEESWQEQGRSGRPRLAVGLYYRLGSDAVQRSEAYIRDYYAFAGTAVEQIVQGIIATPEAIKGAIQGYESVGVDEIIFWPTVAELDQIDRLAEVVGQSAATPR
jgi:alkanesulfonate monooxygenase SsuD/methylene tetrahydromethanopterin reductase-like flavin-dependent oxidoreductase (luciferase family)